MKTPAELDLMGHDKWQKGLCHIFAEILQKFLSRGKIGAIWVNGGFKHVYLSDVGFAYDARAEEEKEKDLWERWRIKYDATAVLSKTIVPTVADLVSYGIKFGTTEDCDLYEGPECQRWLKEAEDTIRKNAFFKKLRRGS